MARPLRPALLLALAACSSGGSSATSTTGHAGGSSATTGSGGAVSTGTAGTGGTTGSTSSSAPDPDAPRPSAGCGKAFAGGFRQVQTTVAGAARAYFVAAPDNLPPSVPQKLVFVWHGCYGNVSGVRQFLNVEDAARKAGDQAIFVYPQSGTGGADTNEDCFATDDEQAYFQQVLGEVLGAACVDRNQVFSTGYSSGGIVSEVIAPVEGGLPSGQSACPGKVDALVIHNPKDEQIGWAQAATQTSHSWSDGRGAVPLRFFHDNDGCTAPPFDPADAALGRVDYTCGPSGDGVHPFRVSRWLHDYAAPWATDTPNHWFPPEAPGQIWAFFAATP
jgi:poly(3-hydroxybutyrate) depolymerase